MLSNKVYNVGVSTPKLEGVYIYKMHGITKDKDGNLEGPMMRNVPYQDQIIQEGKVINIASILSIDAEGNTEFDPMFFSRAEAWQIALDSSVVANRARIEYLELCNYNTSNPNRDSKAEAIFYRVDLKKEAEQAMNTKRTKHEAMSRAFALTGPELLEFATIRGLKTTDADTLSQLAVEAAESDSVAFMSLPFNQDSFGPLIKQAQSKGLIKFDGTVWVWADTKEEIVKSTSAKKSVEDLTAHLKSEEGKATLQHLKEKIG